MSLAACFSELAAQERALADSYIRLAAIYESKTTPPGRVAVPAREMADQYKRVAETERKAAAAAEGVAAYQSRVAEQIGNTSVLTLASHGTRSFAALGK